MSFFKPRFTINKNRIRTSGLDSPAEDFTPDKIIYVELDDEITHVFDRIKRLRADSIALVVPKRAYLLQSIINLKILKKKIDELEKKIILITSDESGLILAEKAGIPAAKKLFEKAENEPLTKGSLPLPTERPIRMTGKKVSLAEVIRPEKNTRFGSILSRLREYFKKKKNEPSKSRLVFVAPNKQALFTLILISIFLLLAIAYIALPGATITITPRSTILDPAFNITFMDFEKNRDLLQNPLPNSIALATFPLKPPAFTKTYSHRATGKTFRGENAKGLITVINLSRNPWELAARTRFQTAEGLVFRILSLVRVPAARGSIPGTLDVTAVADEFDATNQPIGGRGNIPPSKFFLPGLKNEENRKKLYGESRSPMTGGITRIIKSVSTEDLTAARETVKKEIQKGAIEDLKKYAEEQNLLKKTNLTLLADRNVIRISEPTLRVPEGIIGKEIEQFEIIATYTLNGVAYDRGELIQLLKERLRNRVDPDKKIVKIQENDLSYKFLDEDTNTGKIRVTGSMRAIQVYELDPEKENGQRFLKKITDHILGTRVQDAIVYLQQQTDEIAHVEIKLWPVWAPTIPNIADNVKFVIREEENI